MISIFFPGIEALVRSVVVVVVEREADKSSSEEEEKKYTEKPLKTSRELAQMRNTRENGDISGHRERLRFFLWKRGLLF
jgi:hypothetical protein